MTKETYEKAKEIQDSLDKLNKLRFMTHKPWIRFIKERTWLTDYDKREVCLCDEDLTNVISDYCDKKIKELKEELKSL